MAFFEKLKKKLFMPSASVDSTDSGGRFGVSSKKKKHAHLVRDKDPATVWEIVGELGDGAFGKVYKARNKHTNVYAAAKIVEKCSEDELEDYMIEIDILSECKNRSIVEIYEAYFYDSKLWLLIEFCSGGAVDNVMLELDKCLTEKQIHFIISELLEALVYLHETCYIIHRDIKAGNVLLTESGAVKLADFGVSAKNYSPLQRRDTFIGTPYWMAPEVINCDTDKENPYDYKADVWSLGITCIEMAEKEPPHNELNANRVLMKIRKSDPPKLQEPNKWSKSFNDFVAKCLDKSPEVRPTARELLKHPFIANNQRDIESIKVLLSEKNATVNEVIEEIQDDQADSDSENAYQENKKSSPASNNVSTNSGNNEQQQVVMRPPQSSVKIKHDSKPKESPPVSKPIAPPLPPPPPPASIAPTPIPPPIPEASPLKNAPADDDSVTHYSFQLPPPPTASEIEELNKTSLKSDTDEMPKVEPPSPFGDKTMTATASVMVTPIYTDDDDREALASVLFEDICEEVIKCDHAAPSVPDVILQVISEYLAESQVTGDESNEAHVATATVTNGSTATATVKMNAYQKEEPLIEAKVTSNGYNYDSNNMSSTSATSISAIVSPAALAAPAIEQSKQQPVPNSTIGTLVQNTTTTAGNGTATARVDANQAKLNRNRTRKTITKTFMVDGKTVTQTIKKTVNLEEEERLRRMQEERKRDLIEHRRNLNEDKRKISDLTRKQENEKEALEQDFKEQKEKLLREFDVKLAQIYQYRKAEIERCEEAQAIELKTAIKRLKSDQDKLLKAFREHLKDELKAFKKELDSNQQLNREHRDMYKKQKEKELLKREEEFIQRQLDDLSVEEKRIIKLHKQQLTNLEAASLVEKQNLIRTREAAIWELEHRQMDNKYNVIRKHVRDFFYLQRHLMLTKQEKDIEHLRTINTKLEEDLIRRQNEEKRLFTKSLRQEQRSRREMYRRSLYIIPTNLNFANPQALEKISADEEKRKIKEFEEKEKERFESEIQRLTIRHLKQIEENRITAENLIKDLEEEQRLKRKQLVDAETKCVRDVDEAYNRDYTNWQTRLRTRKQKLEEDFKKEELDRVSQLHNNSSSNVLSASHSYPFRSFSPNNNNNYSSIGTAAGTAAAAALSPSSSSSSEMSTANDLKNSFSSMKINRKDDTF